MANTYDWLFWIGGGVLGITGVILLVWSLFADRSKGRKRCPKCWYEMTHSPGLTCSECGRTAMREKKLFNTRRYWRRAFLSVIVLICSYGLAKVPEVYREGWLRFIPTTVLIFTLSDSPTDGQLIADELGDRIDNLELSEWQWQKLFSKVNKGAIPPYTLEVVSRENWLRGYKLTANAKLTRRNIGWKAFDDLEINARIVSDCKPWSPVIINDPKVRFSTWSRFRGLAPNTTPKVTKLDNIDLGITDTNEDSLTLEISVVLVQNSRKSINLASDSRTIKLVDSIDSILEKVKDSNVDKHLYENMTFKSSPIYTDYRTLTDKLYLNLFSTDDFAGDKSDYTIPLTIELLLNGDIVSSTSTWLTSTDIYMWSNELRWESWHDPTRLWKEEDKLSVRVRGEFGVALRNLECDRYWGGEFELPVYWIGNKWHAYDEVVTVDSQE